ncbi:MAG: hypothetical protein UU08_C0003G0046 [Candidatus Uhrbacteria bacterium GW2011_GWE2_40_58]|nr:MAG: hypothetical protein UT94_C0043G0009 [Candidatus Uhrbacteria bacterium GW2011_GWF2_40_263]KKR68123.1 MAG: hypothetical protein UU08_C0003G0046 [Candidatus Uhrbacteria bacterium GW2011_GWE2_40_58]
MNKMNEETYAIFDFLSRVDNQKTEENLGFFTNMIISFVFPRAPMPQAQDLREKWKNTFPQ